MLAAWLTFLPRAQPALKGAIYSLGLAGWKLGQGGLWILDGDWCGETPQRVWADGFSFPIFYFSNSRFKAVLSIFLNYPTQTQEEEGKQFLGESRLPRHLLGRLGVAILK